MITPASGGHMNTAQDWELVVGVEVHAQLSTASKLFCGCTARFGATPNSQTCPVCLGLPGSLPVINQRAFDYCLMIALALNCQVEPETVFERKNYYYPDLPKNYQISQQRRNLGENGWLRLPSSRRIRIHNVHLEEDAGKLIHPEESERDATLVDLNRAGTPLAEIVTEPDMRSLDEVRDYMEALKSILAYLDVCDCKMQEGSLRFEASISVRPRGTESLGKRVEVKNLNSNAAVLKSVDYEFHRQVKAIERGEAIEQETRLWDDDKGCSRRMRSKEHAHDYRFFPDPDLLPVRIANEQIEALRSQLPELPQARRQRFAETLGLPAYDADVLTAEKDLADWFEAAVELYSGAAKQVANWVMNLLLAVLNQRNLSITESPVSPAALIGLLEAIDAGEVSKDAARKEVFPRMLDSGKSARDLIKELGLTPLADEAALRGHVLDALAQNPKAVADYRNGKQAAAKSFMGLVMRATKGKADPKLVSRLLAEELGREGA